MTTRRLIVALVAVVVTLIVLYNLRSQSSPTNVPAADTRAPYTVHNVNGTIAIPGTAYIEAWDPATNSTIPAINVRARAVSAQPPACQLHDGNSVQVSDSTSADGSAWLYVTSGNCSGWVLSEFVTPDR